MKMKHHPDQARRIVEGVAGRTVALPTQQRRALCRPDLKPSYCRFLWRQRETLWGTPIEGLQDSGHLPHLTSGHTAGCDGYHKGVAAGPSQERSSELDNKSHRRPVMRNQMN